MKSEATTKVDGAPPPEPAAPPEHGATPPPAVQQTHDDIQLYLQEGAGMATAIELVKVQHAREIRDALAQIHGVLGEIADK